MVLLIADGENFTFHVVSGSKREAVKAFRAAWKRHVMQTGAESVPENAVTINYIADLKLNAVYRDYEVL